MKRHPNKSESNIKIILAAIVCFLFCSVNLGWIVVYYIGKKSNAKRISRAGVALGLASIICCISFVAMVNIDEAFNRLLLLFFCVNIFTAVLVLYYRRFYLQAKDIIYTMECYNVKEQEIIQHKMCNVAEDAVYAEYIKTCKEMFGDKGESILQEIKQYQI